MKITIAAHTVLYNNPSNPPAFARVYCNELFVNEDGQTVLAGSIEGSNYVKQVAVTNSDAGAEIATFNGANEIDSSVDENGVTESTYALTLHDANGRHLVTLYPNLRIPQTPTTTTWGAIVLFNQAQPQAARHEFYDTLQTNALIDEALTGSVLVTGNQTVAGVKTFSSSPVIPAPTTNLQAATKLYVDDAVAAGGATSLYALEFTPNQVWNAGYIGHNAYHGNFWAAGDTPGNFFAEAWMCPLYNSWYVISGGFGGAHPILLGCNGASSGKIGITGNVYDGSSNISFTSVDGIDPNTWHHIAVGLDETANFLYLYLDGVLTGQTAFTGTRTVGGSAADIGLYIGGSDHSNFSGKILRVRIFEDQIPFAGGVFPGAFSPRTYFGSTINTNGSSTTEYASNFAVDYGKVSEALIDYSAGYNNSTHSGYRAISNYGGQSASDAKLPQWVLANFTAPTYADTPESIPPGAIIFDDFSRNNQTFAWRGGESSDYPYIGIARTGQSWLGTSGGAPTGQPDMGILEGSAVSIDGNISSGASTWMSAGTANYTLTIDRKGSGAINAIVRRADANNYFLIALSSTDVAFYKKVAGVGPTAVAGAGTIPADPLWTRATITVSGTTATVAFTGGGGKSVTIDGALTGQQVGFSIAGVSRVRRFLVT